MLLQVVLQRLDVPNMKFRQEHAVGLCVCNSMGEGKPALASPMSKRMNNTQQSQPGSPGSPGSPTAGLGSPMGQLTAAPTQNDLSRKMIVGSKQLVAESEYTSLAEGSLLLCMEEGAEYVVVPSTFNPDIFGHFALKFISSSPVGAGPTTARERESGREKEKERDTRYEKEAQQREDKGQTDNQTDVDVSKF